MNKQITTFSFPTLIHFGAGARHQVSDHLKNLHYKRPLFVTDCGVATLPFFTDLHEILSKNGLQVAVYSGVQGNPIKSQVDFGVTAYKSHDADCIIGVGGGAALDVAKAIALMINHPGDIFDYEDDYANAICQTSVDQREDLRKSLESKK